MRKLIIDGNAVYELDENCMLKKEVREKKDRKRNQSKGGKKK